MSGRDMIGIAQTGSGKTLAVSTGVFKIVLKFYCHLKESIFVNIFLDSMIVTYQKLVK